MHLRDTIVLLLRYTPTMWPVSCRFGLFSLRHGTLGLLGLAVTNRSVPVRQVSWSAVASRKSSTFYNRLTSGFWVWYSLKSLCRPSSKMVGECLNPCGSLVHVTWLLTHIPESCLSKAKYGWLLEVKGKLKKASFRSRTGYHCQSRGNELSRVYGLGTMGCMLTTLSSTSLRSWTSLQSLVCGFLTDCKGVFQADCTGWRIPKSNNCLICEVIPFLASKGMGYWQTLTRSAPYLIST